MSRDRYVYFAATPSMERVRMCVEDFFGGAASMRDPSAGMFDVELPGATSDPARRAAPDLFKTGRYDQPERWIEVWRMPDYINVLTRMQDPYTDALADGLARTLARLFDGEVSP